MITIHSIESSPLADLSPRQDEVLSLLCQGAPNKLIAHALGLAEATVKVYVQQMLRRTGATNRTQLVVMAAREKRI